MELPKRKRTRFKDYDYSKTGYYFVTVCSVGRQNIFGSVVGGGAFDAPKVILSQIGKVAEKYILSSNNIPQITVDKYVIMPNHIHLILTVNNQNGTSRAPSPTNEIIPHTFSTFKRFVNRETRKNIFQRSFYDHIIRGEKDYREIWNYIDTNPAKWENDCFYNDN